MQELPFRFEDARSARENLRGVARRTPLLPATDAFPRSNVYLKAENLQLTHAFKFRGAYNRVSRLGEADRRRGLIAASSGNHALGLSLAGSMLDAPVVVVMPEEAPEVKERGCRGYGARVLRHGETYDDALEFATEMARERGYTYVQSFDDPLVAAGQSTATWEILEDLPEVDVLVLPIGGGGLATGALGLLQSAPDSAFPHRSRPLRDVSVVGVQAEGAASMLASVSAGRRMALPKISTVADGIAVRQPGELTFGVVRAAVDELVTVSDAEMMEMVGLLALREKLVVETAGAAAAAAVLAGRGKVLSRAIEEGLSVVCVLSGGNLQADVFCRALRCARGRGEGEST